MGWIPPFIYYYFVIDFTDFKPRLLLFLSHFNQNNCKFNSNSNRLLLEWNCR